MSINDGSVDPLDTLDMANILPGAFPIDGRNSPPVIQETIDPDDIFENSAVVAEVVPDEEEMVAEMKERLRKEIKDEEAATRLMTEGRTEGQPPVVAEVVTAGSTNQKIPSRRAWRSMLLVVILIVVGIVVGVVVTKPHDVGVVPVPQDDSGVVTTRPQEDAGVVEETREDDNITVCLGATLIEEGQITISSWNQAEATAPDGSFYSSVCSPYDDLGTIYWFSLVGTGDAYLVSTCSSDLNFDSSLSVVTGSCDKLQCIEFTDPTIYYSGNCTESSYYAGPVLFRTDVGVLYYIGVSSSYLIQSELNFTLSITKVVNAPVNSDCSNSIVIKQGENLVQGTITNATVDMNFNNTCVSSASVWYSLMGTGDIIDISASTDDDFYSELTVSKGTCENLDCMVSLNGVEDWDGWYIPARVSFRSEVGVEYFLQVHQDYYFTYDTWIGNFTLEISFLSGGPANEDCRSAPVVELGSNGSSVMGSMGNTYWDPNMNASCAVELTHGVKQIVWYSLIGTGDVYEISTCSSVLNFNSTLSVMTGGCDSLECLIRAAEYYCPEASYRAGRTLLRTEVGVEYFIAVEAGTGYTLEGNFSLNVSIFKPLPNGECSGALDIQANGETVYGTILEIFPTVFNSTSYGFGPDFWYRIIGDGKSTVASLCDSAYPYSLLIEKIYYPLIQIFEGDGVSCNQTLVAENGEEFCDVLWFAEQGVTYYIRVGSYDGETGQFGLTLLYPL